MRGEGALAEAEKRFREALETFDSVQAGYDAGRPLRSGVASRDLKR